MSQTIKDSESILKKITNLIVELGVDENKVLLESDLINDLNIDSLGKIELTMMLEEEFKSDSLKISEESSDKIKTVNDLVNYVVSAKSEK